MSDRLPPLTALRAFDAAARHMSFAKAAEELHVTPAALSFQIKALETALGQPVFKRLNRAVELTDAGRTLAPGVADGFRALGAAWSAARRRGRANQLAITAGPAFTAKWLAPRIFAFAADHPEIELRFAASLRLMDFDRDGIDVAIRFGPGPDTGLYARPLIREWVTPMVSPDLAGRVTTPAELAALPLFYMEDTTFVDPPIDWTAWFTAAGHPDMEIHGPSFSQHDHALDAAAAGAGAVLGRISLASGDLASGRLAAPFRLALRTDAHYRFVCPLGAQTTPAVQAFEEWVLGQVPDLERFDSGMEFVEASDLAPR
ncbi:MAG: transcriptional regulator GcvA [Rhodobacteraceae bacterium]|nr:transcriptional regulator GcvA [Paracoccaceae bacterium]